MNKKQQEITIETEEIETETRIPVIGINFDEYDPKNIDVWDTYIPVSDEKKNTTRAILDAKFPYLIESEKGQGKTLLVYTICKENHIALIDEQVGPGTRKTDLIGSKEINRNGTLYNLGILPKAIEIANHFGHACLYCDEGNTQDPEVQKLWNRICDGRKSIFANGKKYKLKPDCKLSIIWTINPITYAGINSMPEDLRSRFIGNVWNYPTNEEIDRVVDWSILSQDEKPITQGDGFVMVEAKSAGDTKKWKAFDSRYCKEPLLTFVQDIHALRMKGDVEYSLSIRDIKQFCEYIRYMINEPKPIERAIKEVILVKFTDPAERELARIRANDTFGVTV